MPKEFDEDDILDVISEPKPHSTAAIQVLCPFCSGVILNSDQLCKHCGRFLGELESPPNADPNAARDESVRCPKCKSTQLHAGQRGWNFWDGWFGSSSIVITCLSCGHGFKPGGIQSNKRGDAIQVQSILGAFAGVFLFFGGLILDSHFIFGASLLLLFASLCWWLVGRVGAWWNHG